MILKYFPSKGVIIDDVAVNFFDHRNLVRKNLNWDYEEDNQIIQLGADLESLQIRRDIYKGANSAELFFFLDYDENDVLTEIEVYQCDSIQVLDISFEFNDEIDPIALRLSEYSEIEILSEGEFLFKDLQMTLSDKRKMGAEGSTIGYFYCASDISHLI